MTHAWIDASAGIAGDMLLAALLDAGASLDAVREAVETVAPGSVRIEIREVRRAGMRALHATVHPLVESPPSRTWRDIRTLLEALPGKTRERAQAVFTTLAEAEAFVHGTPADEVHFHEVGAWDSIADVVGVSAALTNLNVTTISAGEVAVGSGRARTTHGDMPVPVPAVAHLAQGWRIRAGGEGELATPTGMAILRALAPTCENLPALTVTALGVGAGTKDFPTRANVVRAVLGTTTTSPATSTMLMLETNVDDLDPRLWPGILNNLLNAGAADAWLTPILMKKGRPAHTLSVLCTPDKAQPLRTQIFQNTTTLGIRTTTTERQALTREFTTIHIRGATIKIKLAYAAGRLIQAMPEFEDVATLARSEGVPERTILQEAQAAATAAGLIPE